MDRNSTSSSVGMQNAVKCQIDVPMLRLKSMFNVYFKQTKKVKHQVTCDKKNKHQYNQESLITLIIFYRIVEYLCKNGLGLLSGVARHT